jgi:serine protease inhibitor
MFMHQIEYFPYSSAAVPNYQIVQLPLRNMLSMILAVPISKNAVLTNSRAVVSAVPQLESQRIGLGLPQFQFETFYKDDLKAALRNAGVDLPFAVREAIFVSLRRITHPFWNLYCRKQSLASTKKG